MGVVSQLLQSKNRMGSTPLGKWHVALAVLALSANACRTEHESGELAATSTRAPASSSLASALPKSRSAETTDDTLALNPPHHRTSLERRIQKAIEAATEHPNHAVAWLGLGQLWIAQARLTNDPGYYLSADACAEHALQLQPELQPALTLRGLVLLNQHRFVEARHLAERVLRGDAKDDLAWGIVSDASLELGDYVGAEAAVDHMLESRPGLPAFTRLAHLRWLRGDQVGALEAVRLAVDAGDPKQPEPLAWVLVQAAQLFWHAGDGEGAAAGFRQALIVSPDYPAALVGLARVTLANERCATSESARAIAWLRRAYEQNPAWDTAALLVQALERVGQTAEASAIQRRIDTEAERSDPRWLALEWARRGVHIDRALELARAEFAARPDVYSADALAWALYRTGEFGQAAQLSQRFIGVGSLDARLLFHRGAIAVAAGQAELGRRWLSGALARNPHFQREEAQHAARLLRELGETNAAPTAGDPSPTRI